MTEQRRVLERKVAVGADFFDPSAYPEVIRLAVYNLEQAGRDDDEGWVAAKRRQKSIDGVEAGKAGLLFTVQTATVGLERKRRELAVRIGTIDEDEFTKVTAEIERGFEAIREFRTKYGLSPLA